MKIPRISGLMIFFALGASLLLTQCVSSTGGGLVASDSLATPAHSLSQSEYPFDAQGNYHEEWVRGGGSRSSRSSSKPTATRSSSGSSSSGSSGSSTKTKTYTAPKPASKPASTSRKLSPAPSSSKTHTVAKGDTLWGISRRYGVSVGSLKSANSLSADLIKPGQRLKIP